MVSTFKWLCDEVVLDVNDKDKVTLLDIIMDWEDERVLELISLSLIIFHLHVYGKSNLLN